MELSLENFNKSLRTGFIDHTETSYVQYRPQLLVNDKVAKKKILTTILKELKTCNEFWISAAFVTTSGVATLMNSLIELAERNVPGKILVSQYLNFTQPEALRRLLQFKNLELKIATEGNFHSKGYLFKHGEIFDIIIGSSNLTANALCTNKEWNLKVSAYKDSELVNQSIEEFKKEFQNSKFANENFIKEYSDIYKNQKNYYLDQIKEIGQDISDDIKPNLIQKEALRNLKELREKGGKKALIISATGTGKTYLSAFDVREFKPKKFLFVVHRRNIAEKAMDTFSRLLGNQIKTGLLSGDSKDFHADYVFSTIQTISIDENLHKFSKDHFDYIVIDETHRADADTYKKLMNYFDPRFLLGMTATPERTDGGNIFKLFDHNIAYEIRLQHALEKEMLSPFHYYGVTELLINGEIAEDSSDFNLLVSDERVERIIQKSMLYGSDDGIIRGLIFCSNVKEAKELSVKLNHRKFKTVALSGENSEYERSESIRKLESDDPSERLDYILTVDIFNEGIDIPKVNQIIMLRPTQSAIIFVQQLGRGLRKLEGKEYLTVIDFIGNYTNNFMIPIALFGDSSYNKDNLKKLVINSNNVIPGSSTLNFDRIAMNRIIASINVAKLMSQKDLLADYNLLKYKLGRIPTMCDFLDHGNRDPYLYAMRFNSFCNFLVRYEEDAKEERSLNPYQMNLLKLFSKEINNGKRIEETILLEMLIENNSVSFDAFRKKINSDYGYEITEETLKSCENNLSFLFAAGKKDPHIIELKENNFVLQQGFIKNIQDSTFKKHLLDTISYAKKVYNSSFVLNNFIDGFQLYSKYSRKDVFRILNWEQNPNPQTVGGYLISADKKNCALFVTYHKQETISDSTKYHDIFIDKQTFQWMSKNQRTLLSPDVAAIKEFRKHNLRIPLFIKKNDDKNDSEFYYVGNCEPIIDSFEETSVGDKPVVKIVFKLSHVVEDNLFEYLTTRESNIDYS